MEKRFCLVKTYPGSPKLGTIVDRRGSFVYFDVNSPNINNTVSQNYVENYPDYWKEIIENYKILSYYNHNMPHLIFILMANGKFMYGNRELSEKHGCYIHSIKRSSDGEVFTVGDVIMGFNNYKTEIEKISFNIQNNLLISAKTKECFSLKNLIKIKTSLFTTEDGIEIFKGDEYCYFRFHSWTYDMVIANEDFYSQDKLSTNGLYFSTKEKADKYILINKPCLSVEDVRGCINETEIDIDNEHELNYQLLELVKQKLNK